MSEKRFKMEIPINNGKHPLLKDNETGEIVEIVNVEMLIKKMNEQQATINKLRKILAEAEDTIEIRLPEHYLKEYENIKHNIIGDNDE